MSSIFKPYSPTNPADPDEPIDLIAALLDPASGLSLNAFSNITVTTSILSTFFYDGSISQLGIAPGLLLTTGGEPGNTNSDSGYSVDNGLPGDADLDTVVPGKSSYNATYITFDLTINNPAITGIQFSVVFGSEEYPEWVNSYPDIGAVFVNGTNYALFNNNPDQPLSVLGQNLDAGNFKNNAANAVAPWEYDGISAPLTIIAPVVQGVNTFKIAIGDLGDPALDSGMIISGLKAVATGGGGGLLIDLPGTDDDDDIEGTDNNEIITGGPGNDKLQGKGGNDFIYGNQGNDTLHGNGGNDFLEGGEGDDEAHFNGNKGDYEITYDPVTGFVIVKDLREDSPDGTDTVTPDTELLVFADGSIPISDYLPVTNVAPVADNDAYTTAFGTQLVVSAANGVLDGDTDADGDALTALLVSGPGKGTLSLAEDGSFIYTPNAGATGADSFTYKANDGALDSNVATVSLTIGANPNPPPPTGGSTVTPTNGSDTLTGTSGNDSIVGLSGNDVLHGGRGNDTIVGGSGSDVLFGGLDADTFVWSAGHITNGATDYIVDFQLSHNDRLQFLASGGGQQVEILSVTKQYLSITEFNGVDLQNNVATGTDLVFSVRNSVTGAQQDIVLLDAWSGGQAAAWNSYLASLDAGLVLS